MKYKYIQNLDDDTNKLASKELATLAKLWNNQKKQLENSHEYKQFVKKMQREWAIETGIIERLYTWDRGITESLIEHGIDAAQISQNGINREEADNISNIIKDQQQMVEGLFEFVKGDQLLSEHFIRSMHEVFVAHQDFTDAQMPEGKIIKVSLLKGQYKEHPNNPKKNDGSTHVYCPPEFVNDEMQKLVKLYNEYDKLKVAPEILSAWVHHCFTQIHPFQDGNGRIARAIATLVFLKAGLFPLVVRDSDRTAYINALEKADNNDISDLVQLFTKRQRDCILSALNIRQQVEKSHFADKIFASGLNLLKDKYSKQKDKNIKKLFTLANTIQKYLVENLKQYEKKFDKDLLINNAKHGANVTQASQTSDNNHWFRTEIIEMANKYDYYADTKHYKSWSRLVIKTENIFEIVFSIHGYGHKDNGVMAVSCFTFEKNKDGKSESFNIKSSQQNIFVFNYLENEEEIIKRLNEWFEDSFVIAIAEWKQSI